MGSTLCLAAQCYLQNLITSSFPNRKQAYQEKHPDEKPKYLQKGDFGMPRTGQQKFSLSGHQTDRQMDRCLNVKLEILGE